MADGWAWVPVEKDCGSAKWVGESLDAAAMGDCSKLMLVWRRYEGWGYLDVEADCLVSTVSLSTHVYNERAQMLLAESGGQLRQR